MGTWYDYRLTWAAHPWVILIAVLGAVLVVAAVIGTALQNLLAILFIPGLAVLYIHHLIVQRVSSER